MLDCIWVSYSQLSPETFHFSHSAVSFTTISPYPCSLRVRREAEDKRREPSPQSSIMPQVEPENRPPGRGHSLQNSAFSDSIFVFGRVMGARESLHSFGGLYPFKLGALSLLRFPMAAHNFCILWPATKRIKYCRFGRMLICYLLLVDKILRKRWGQ